MELQDDYGVVATGDAARGVLADLQVQGVDGRGPPAWVGCAEVGSDGGRELLGRGENAALALPGKLGHHQSPAAKELLADTLDGGVGSMEGAQQGEPDLGERLLHEAAPPVADVGLVGAGRGLGDPAGERGQCLEAGADPVAEVFADVDLQVAPAVFVEDRPAGIHPTCAARGRHTGRSLERLLRLTVGGEDCVGVPAGGCGGLERGFKPLDHRGGPSSYGALADACDELAQLGQGLRAEGQVASTTTRPRLSSSLRLRMTSWWPAIPAASRSVVIATGVRVPSARCRMARSRPLSAVPASVKTSS